MKKVIIESPYAGDIERNIAYAKRALLDSLSRNEAPFASHMLYPQVLDDGVPRERTLGMDAGFAWGAVADAVIAYADYGFSDGMLLGMRHAAARKQKISIRYIGPNP